MPKLYKICVTVPVTSKNPCKLWFGIIKQEHIFILKYVTGVLFNGEQVVLEHELLSVKDKSQYKFINQIHEQERDLSKHWIPHKIIFALYGFEHQTDPNPFAPIRLIGYDGTSYRGQLTRQEKDKSKYPVITIILYFGLKH